MPGVPRTVDEATRRQYLASEAAAKVVSDQALNAKDQADLAVQADQRKADLAQQQLQETDRENERQRKGLEAATAERDKLREDTKNFRFHNYWDNQSTESKGSHRHRLDSRGRVHRPAPRERCRSEHG